MNLIVEEAVDEAIGRSSKRWALVLLLFLVGGLVGLWLANRSHAASPDESSALTGSTDPEPTPD